MIQYRHKGGLHVNWETLFAMQKKLDNYISDQHQLDNKNLLEERFLALLVELGELANETRCFKFWSTQAASERAIILEEYVDNIHFLLSIGLHTDYQFQTIEVKTKEKETTLMFNEVFTRAMTFYKERTENNYLALFEAYIQLADILGFTENDIIEAYHKKNEINYARQDSGY